MERQILKDGDRNPVTVNTGSESFVEQHHLEDVDINKIMAKYTRTGLLTHQREYNGQYGDFSQTVDYQTALNTVMLANEMFLELPATVRRKFDNDPGAFLAWADDPENIEEMRELGLARAPVVVGPDDEGNIKPLEEAAEMPDPGIPDTGR